MQRFSQKCFSKGATFILIEGKEKNTQPYQSSVLVVPESLRKHTVTSCEKFSYQTFSKKNFTNCHKVSNHEHILRSDLKPEVDASLNITVEK